MHGIMKHWFDMEAKQHGSAINHPFVQKHVNGYEELKAKVQEQTWEHIIESSGVTKERIIELAEILAKAKNAVFAWALGLTMHSFATDNISQVANLALLRRFVVTLLYKVLGKWVQIHLFCQVEIFTVRILSVLKSCGALNFRVGKGI
jgi:hypothetical protein